MRARKINNQDIEISAITRPFKINSTSLYMLTLLITMFVLFPKTTLARNVTLPHTENFDVSGSADDLLRATQGAIASWESSSGWRGGGAVKIVPPLNEGYSNIGGINFPDQTRLNVRWLMKFGRTYQGETPFNKLLILTRADNQRSNRPMIISNGELINGAEHRYWQVTQGIVNIGRPFNRGVEALDPATVYTLGTGYNTEEWVSFEYEVDLQAGRINLYINTEDGRYSGLHATVDMTVTENNPFGNPVAAIECIGCYFGEPGSEPPFFMPPWTSDNYFLIDELVINNSYIGPPSGFGDSSPPAAINDVRGQ